MPPYMIPSIKTILTQGKGRRITRIFTRLSANNYLKDEHLYFLFIYNRMHKKGFAYC
jgi:hypothetical protein